MELVRVVRGMASLWSSKLLCSEKKTKKMWKWYKGLNIEFSEGSRSWGECERGIPFNPLERECQSDTGLWLVPADHVTWILASVWWRPTLDSRSHAVWPGPLVTGAASVKMSELHSRERESHVCQSVNGQFAAVLVLLHWAGCLMTFIAALLHCSMLSLRSLTRGSNNAEWNDSRVEISHADNSMITFKLMFQESSQWPGLHHPLVGEVRCQAWLMRPRARRRLIDANNITEHRSALTQSQHSAYFVHQRSIRLFSRRCLANVYCSKGWDPVLDFVKTDHGSQSVNIIASTWDWESE